MADERPVSHPRTLDVADVDEFDLAALAGSFECTARPRRRGKRPALAMKAPKPEAAIRRLQAPAQTW